MVVVQELRQLLAQAFVALALMAKQHGPLEQRVLKFGRQIAPQIRCRRPEHKKVPCGIFARGVGFRCARNGRAFDGWRASVAERG